MPFMYKHVMYISLAFVSVIVPASMLMGVSVKSIQKCVQKNERVVIMFSRPSCSFCVYLQTIFNNLKKEAHGKGIVFKVVNIGRDTSLKTKYNFQTVPTVAYFKNGTLIAKHGSNNKRMTIDGMRKYLNTLL